MKTEYTEEQLEQMTDYYATWVIRNCDAPITEVEWLVEQLLDSKHREDIIDLLKTFGD